MIGHIEIETESNSHKLIIMAVFLTALCIGLLLFGDFSSAQAAQTITNTITITPAAGGSTTDPIAKYLVMKKDLATGTFSQVGIVVPPGTSYTDAGNPVGAIQSYKVVAQSQSGLTSPDSNITSCGANPPGAVTITCLPTVVGP